MAIKVDKTTLTATREKYTLGCVQINLRKLLIPYIHLLGYLQKVKYEGLHIIYFECVEGGMITVKKIAQLKSKKHQNNWNPQLPQPREA